MRTIEVLQLYLLIFAPLLWFAVCNQGAYFIIYGATIALGNTSICLIRQIQADMKAHRQYKEKRGYDGKIKNSPAIA